MKLASILKDIEFKENGPAIRVLLETEFTKEIRIVMRKGHSMAKHQTPFPIVVEIVDGAIDFGVNGEVHNFKRGDLVALEGAVPHDLLAVEDSVVRLTLNKSDAVTRVKNVPSK